MAEAKIEGSIIKIEFSKQEKGLAAKSSMLFRLVLHFNKSENGLIFTREIPDALERAKILSIVTEHIVKIGGNYVPDKSSTDAIGLIRNLAARREAVLRGEIQEEKWDKIKPVELSRSLLDYQVDSVTHMVSFPHVANFSVPGSGKTTITYSAFFALKEKGEVKKLLVICPKGAFQPWEEEYEGCTGLPAETKIKRIAGCAPARELIYLKESEEYDIFLTGYGSLRNDTHLVSALIRKYPTMLVLDESHKIKGKEGVTSRACISISPYAKKRAILSGTPVTNNLTDLWSQMTFLWPDGGLLGKLGSYERRIASPDGVEWVKSQLKPFYRRIRKKELNLPKSKINYLRVNMGKKQRRIYRALVEKVKIDLERIEEQEILIEWKRAMLVRLMQAASNPSLLLEKCVEFVVPKLKMENSLLDLLREYSKYEIPAKFEKACQMARILAKDGKKTIIWTSYINNVKAIKNSLADLNALEIFGGIPLKEEDEEIASREKHIREFKNDPKVKVLVANPAACAESISLHKVCHDAIYVDRTYNAGHFIQSMDRIHRIGLPKETETNYYILISKETVDERIDIRLKEKVKLLENLMEEDFGAAELDFAFDENNNLVDGFSRDRELGSDFNDLINQLKGKHDESN